MNLFYGPGDWMGERFNARQRRAIAAWVLIIIAITVPIRYHWKDAVWLVWAISEAALILSMWGVVSAETPVEEQG